MKRFSLMENNRNEIVKNCVNRLREAGAVALLPTETVYGLMSSWDDKAARGRIFAIKARDEKKPLQMLISDPSDLTSHGVVLDKRTQKLVEAFCPGPITIVTHAGDSTIGFRMPDHSLILDIIRELGHPLAATSANRSNKPPALTVDEALDDFDLPPDIIVDSGPLHPDALASTVVSLLEEEIVVLREGVITEDEIIQVLK